MLVKCVDGGSRTNWIWRNIWKKYIFFYFIMHFTCKYNTLKWPNTIFLSFNYTGALQCRSLAVLKWSSSKGLGHMCLKMNFVWKSWITLFATKCLFSSMYTNMLLHIATYYESSSTILADIWFSFNIFFCTTLKLNVL